MNDLREFAERVKRMRGTPYPSRIQEATVLANFALAVLDAWDQCERSGAGLVALFTLRCAVLRAIAGALPPADGSEG